MNKQPPHKNLVNNKDVAIWICISCNYDIKIYEHQDWCKAEIDEEMFKWEDPRK